MAAGSTSTKALNVHSIAIQVPMTLLDRHHRMPTSPVASANSVIGVWTAAARQAASLLRVAATTAATPSTPGPGSRSRGSATR